ncbi:MAG: hypothetical protein ACQKBY_12540 [Verrucomicrobiales bacterium]
MPHPLQNDLYRFIADPAGGSFEALALRLFAWQYENIAPYHHYVRALGRNPADTTRWQDIPALPTNAFKHPHLPICSVLPPSGRRAESERATSGSVSKEEHGELASGRPAGVQALHFAGQASGRGLAGQATFHTSGTTTGQHGQHHFPETGTYQRSILAAWQQLRLPTPPRAFFLSPPPAEKPHSSLIHMFGVLNHAHFGGSDSAFLQKADLLDTSTLRQALAHDASPILLAGTALAFLHLLKTTDPLPLPPGSRLLETGGYKNSRRELSKKELYARLSRHFELPTGALINEYSMTELSSQAYTHGLGQAHRLPPWCRARLTAQGHLILHDLANLHSCAAIRTQDFATLIDDHHFLLHGRDPAALPRGCSLTAEDLRP